MTFGVAQETGVRKAPVGAAAYPDAPASIQQLAAASQGGFMTMGELFNPHNGVWPAVDATNGPLKTDLPITTTAPSFTNMTFIPWDSGKFNKQSQRWMVVPSGQGPAAGQCVSNVATDRGNNYGSSGLPFPAPIDTWWVGDTARIIIQYWVWNGHPSNQNVSTPNHEIHLMASDYSDGSGAMKGIRQMPAVWANGQGGGNQMFYKEYEFTQDLLREFRLMASAGVWFAGIWVSTGSLVNQAPNKPICFVGDGDSWGEPVGNVWSSVGGNGGSAGVTYPSGCSLLFSNTNIQLAIATGMAVIMLNHGGTGYFNAGPQGQSNVDVVGFVGFSPFGSTSRINHWSTTYGPESALNRFCTYLMAGGYNDGANYTQSVYNAQCAKAYGKLNAKEAAMPLIVFGIEAKSPSGQTVLQAQNAGLVAAALASPNCIGVVDEIADYTMKGTVGDLKPTHLGPDGLHQTVAGGMFTGVRRFNKLRPMKVSRARVLQTMAVQVP